MPWWSSPGRTRAGSTRPCGRRPHRRFGIWGVVSFHGKMEGYTPPKKTQSCWRNLMSSPWNSWKLHGVSIFFWKHNRIVASWCRIVPWNSDLFQGSIAKSGTSCLSEHNHQTIWENIIIYIVRYSMHYDITIISVYPLCNPSNVLGDRFCTALIWVCPGCQVA